MPVNRSSRTRSREGTRRGGGRRGEYGSGYVRDREHDRGNGGSRYRGDEYRGGRRGSKVKRVGRAVGERVSGMDLDKALVLLHTALALAIVIKQTRSHGRTRRAEPFRSAMSVLNYYLNEGRELTEMQRATLEDIKEELRMLYNREEEELRAET